jgi:hypothetical protein
MTKPELVKELKKYGIEITEKEITDEWLKKAETFEGLLSLSQEILDQKELERIYAGGVDYSMITPNQMLHIATNNPNFTVARKILSNYETEFTIFSCSEEMIDKVIELHTKKDESELEKLVELIKESNAKEQDIEEIRFNKERKEKELNVVDDFFKAFENPNTKERLFIIMGETGVGKSYIVEQRYPNIIQYASNKGLDPYSLCYYLADKDGTGLKPYETPFLQAIRKGEHVFLDEGNELPQDTLMFIQGLTDEKRTVVIGDEVVEIAKGFKILMSLNPPSETDERMPLGDALLGRAVGIVLELTDEIICKRLNVTESWLYSVRTLYNHVRNSGMIDMRELNFRDYQRFNKYNFETQFQFKVCMGDVTNIKEFRKIQSTGEYQRLLEKVLKEVI